MLTDFSSGKDENGNWYTSIVYENIPIKMIGDTLDIAFENLMLSLETIEEVRDTIEKIIDKRKNV